MIQPESERSTHGYPLVSVEVLRYDKRSKSENMGIVPTEMELILEHTQQDIIHEVSVTSTKPGRMTKPYSSHRFIANCFNVRNLKMEVKEANQALGRPKAMMSPLLAHLEGHNCNASRLSKLYAQAQSVDDMPFRTRAYTKYT
nr:hypothetical protein [Tanacetum cinerariifolium]